MHRRDALKTMAAGTLIAATNPVALAAPAVTMVQHPKGCPCPACRPDMILEISVAGGDPFYHKSWTDTYDRVHHALRDVRLLFPEADYIRIKNADGHMLCCEKWTTGWFYELYRSDGSLFIRNKFKRNTLFTEQNKDANSLSH